MTELQSRLEAKPRWPNAPPTCIAANKLAFNTLAAARQFIEKNCPGVTLTSHYECVLCGKIHYEGAMRPPSGATSGGGRRL